MNWGVQQGTGSLTERLVPQGLVCPHLMDSSPAPRAGKEGTSFFINKGRAWASPTVKASGAAGSSSGPSREGGCCMNTHSCSLLPPSGTGGEWN